MEIFTAGFTKRTARDFFESLKHHRIEQLVDVRVNNRSQLAGFTKSDDLEYFLDEIAAASYHHEPLLAPTSDLLKAYRNGEVGWDGYEKEFTALLEERRIEQIIDRKIFQRRTVLLCSEPTPERCHRRLVIEYLREFWGPIETVDI